MECEICGDKGFVPYFKKIEQGTYEFIAHCSCCKGRTFMYDGRKCPKPSPYCVLSVDEVFGHNGVNPFLKNEQMSKSKEEAIRLAMTAVGRPVV